MSGEGYLVLDSSHKLDQPLPSCSTAELEGPVYMFTFVPRPFHVEEAWLLR